MSERADHLRIRLKALRRRVWWRIRYGKHIAPGTWSRGSDYGRELWKQMKAEKRSPPLPGGRHE